MHVELPRLPLTFVPNDTVALVFENTRTIPENELSPLFDAIEDGRIPPMAVIFLERGATMRTLNEAAMRECGWVRG